MAINAFYTFTKIVLGAIEGTALHGSSFFKKGHPLPDETLLRKFLTWYGDSRKGFIVGESWRPLESI